MRLSPQGRFLAGVVATLLLLTIIIVVGSSIGWKL